MFCVCVCVWCVCVRAGVWVCPERREVRHVEAEKYFYVPEFISSHLKTDIYVRVT